MSPLMTRALLALLLVALPLSPVRAADDEVELRFYRDGREVARLSRAQLTRAAGTEDVAGYDPYYKRPKRWRALPLAAVLRAGFGAADPGTLSAEDFVLRARDGYTVPIPGSRLLEGGAALAIADLDVPAWEPIGPQRAHPGPFYLVWRRPEQRDLTTHPRPWQLAAIEIVAFEKRFPHTLPQGLPPNAPAWRGLALFRGECIRCHAINREGGRTGPELNVPQSIVEYRPEPQIRAYIRDPRTFRYGNMPPHPGLTDADLDALLAYFRAMKDRKVDPDAGKP